MCRQGGTSKLNMEKQSWTIKKDHIYPLLGRLLKKQKIIAPLQEHGDILYDFIDNANEVVLDFGKPIMPPKRFFLPQMDVIMNYKKKGRQTIPEPIVSKMKRIIFGTRSCDVNAIKFLDNFFSGRYQDTYYLSRRENTTIVNIACTEPCEMGFCPYSGTGPAAEDGFSLQLTDIGDCYFVQVGSQQGLGIIEKNKIFFKKATKVEEDKRFEVILECKSKFGMVVDLSLATKKLIEREVEEEVWQDLARRCQNCGGCAYICPTCSCFYIFDRPKRKYGKEREGKRYRNWDACTFEGFTRMAGGHNPRWKSEDKVKRRFYHKLVYELAEFNTRGCVGCGRCTMVCLGNIDMAGVVRRIVTKKQK